MIHDRRCVKPELDNGKEIKLETRLNKGQIGNRPDLKAKTK